MRLFPLATVLLLAGCGATQAGLPESPVARRAVTQIETGEGETYVIAQMVESNLSRSTIDVPAQTAWSALPDVFQELGIPVTMVDASAKILGTRENRVRRLGSARPSRYLECGSGMAGQYANLYDVYLTVVTQLFPTESGGTEVRTQIEASAKDSAHSNNPVRCTTKGTLEKAIVDALTARSGGSSR